MQLVKQSFEILEQKIPVRKLDDHSCSHFREQYMENMYKHIELCGRVCYHSLDRIAEDSAEKFVKGLIKSGHNSVLEHGVVYLRILVNKENHIYKYLYNAILEKYKANPYSKTCTFDSVYGFNYIITTNYRTIIENGWEDDLQYLCEPTKYHEKRHTVLLHSCIHCYKDLTRHRKISFSIESTRYCRYSDTERFGEMKFVLPPWCKYISPGRAYWYDGICYRTGAIEENNFMGDRSWTKPSESDDEKEWKAELKFIRKLDDDSKTYNELIELGWQPQQAAEILPQCTAADVVMSGYSSDWEFIFSLRTSYIHATGQPHPLVSEIMDPLYDEFVNKQWIRSLK